MERAAVTITIKDVAKLAGVAPSTVSRVIANSNRISQQTKVKVFQAMEQLGYHPNHHARSLAVKSTKCVGIIMPRSTEQAFLNPFFPEVLRGISVRANEKSFALILSTGGNEEEQMNTVVDMVQGRRVDGVISLYSRKDDPIQEYLLKQNFPFVLVGKPESSPDQISYVDNDNVAAGRDITNHLIKLGHQEIAFIGGSLDFTVTRERLKGFEQAIHEHGISTNPRFIIHGEFLHEGGYQAVKKLFTIEEKAPTALVVVDDLMALGVMSALNELNIEIPKQVSIASMNNLLISRVSTPPLTSVDIGIYDLGYQAMDKLLYWIENEKPELQPTIIQHELKERLSTDVIKK